MAEQLGRHATVEISTDGGSTYNTLGELKDPDLGHNVDLHDVTANDDDAWKTTLIGHKQLMLSGVCNYDKTNTAQMALITAFDGSTTVAVRFRPYGNTSGHKQYTFTADVSSADTSFPTQGVAELSFELQSNGTVTYGTI